MPSSILIRGTEGPQGIPGVVGPTGPTGPAGSSGLQANSSFFTTNGTWTCPADVTKVWVSMVGGGGGGGNGYTDANSGTVYYAGGGGSGFYVVNYQLTVVPGTPYAITIGGGGPPNVYYQHPQPNTPGGTTSFGVLLSILGGQPGESAFGSPSGYYVTEGGIGGICGQPGSRTYDETGLYLRTTKGCGGSSPFGKGGLSYVAGYLGYGTTDPIAPTGYGAGGYGGYGSNGAGSSGTSGCLLIFY